MAGRKRVKPTIKVASARQLWTANRHGLLMLRPEPDPDRPLTVADLWEPVGRAIESEPVRRAPQSPSR